MPEQSNKSVQNPDSQQPLEGDISAQHTVSHTSKKFKIITISAFVIILFSVSGFFVYSYVIKKVGNVFYGEGLDSAITEQDVVSYLESKYSENFSIDTVKENRYWNGTDKYVVYPDSNPSVLFEVYGSKENITGDTYAYNLWGKELTQQYIPDIENIFGKDAAFAVTLRSGDSSEANMVGMKFDDYLDHLAKIEEPDSVHVAFNIAVPEDFNQNRDSLDADSLSALEILSKVGTNRFTLSLGVVRNPLDFQEFLSQAEIHDIAWDNSPIDGVIGYLNIPLESEEVIPTTLINRYHAVEN